MFVFLGKVCEADSPQDLMSAGVCAGVGAGGMASYEVLVERAAGVGANVSSAWRSGPFFNIAKMDPVSAYIPLNPASSQTLRLHRHAPSTQGRISLSCQALGIFRQYRHTCEPYFLRLCARHGRPYG